MKIKSICHTVIAISGVGRGLRPRPLGESVGQSPPQGSAFVQALRAGHARRATSEAYTN